MARTDVHAPSRINPDEYEFITVEMVPGAFGPMALPGAQERIREDMARTGGTYAQHEHGGNCMVCGNSFAIYTELFYHAPTNTYVRMGQDCARKSGFGEPDIFKHYRKQAEGERKARAGKAKAQALLTERGLEQAWAVYVTGTRCTHGPDGGPATSWCKTCAGQREESTIIDIVGKLVKYGDASDKQFEFIGTLLGRINNRANVAAQRAAEQEAAAPCPTGRVRVTGIVVSVKSVPSDFSRYDVLKMVVKADQGFRVYGTAPDALLGAELKGARVAFTATVEPSQDDPKFGFFKRPTKAERLTDAAQEV